MSLRVVAIIQARMASSRLPGKVLLDISGQPMLARVHARTRRAQRVDQVVVATTTDPSDDPVSAYCAAHGMEHTRGSQFDVLDRYYQAASRAGADVVVRVTADCPVIDPALIDAAVGALVEGGFDFVADRLPPPFHRTYPIGLDVEVCTFTALERAWADGRAPVHREHVMPYLYEGVELAARSPALSAGVSARGFKIGLLDHDPDFGEMRWTVDTPEDLEFLREVYRRLGGRDDFTWTDVLKLAQRDPALARINAGVRHKTLTDVDDRASKQ
jgi:spore coat polysaccharide biosynthesis protein SpsF